MKPRLLTHKVHHGRAFIARLKNGCSQ